MTLSRRLIAWVNSLTLLGSSGWPSGGNSTSLRVEMMSGRSSLSFSFGESQTSTSGRSDDSRKPTSVMTFSFQGELPR